LIPFTGDESISYERRKLLLEIVYRNLYRHKQHYVVGNWHKFLLLAIYQFNEYSIPQHETEQLILQSEPQLQKLEQDAVLKDPDERRKLVRDVYTTERAQFNKKRINSDLRNQIYMKIEIARLYRLRFNQLPERVEYIEQQRDSTQVLDLEYDKYVPLEILLAHREATISDLYKANEILIHSDEDFEKAKQMYNDDLSCERGNFTTENDLTIF